MAVIGLLAANAPAASAPKPPKKAVVGKNLNIGFPNSVGGVYGSIAGGSSNVLAANAAFIGGGSNNLVGLSANSAVIGGGSANTVLASESVIVGGTRNAIANFGPHTFIGAGQDNSASGFNVFIGGGGDNTADFVNACVIVGGIQNTISSNASFCFIGGGAVNVISENSDNAVIGGGQYNFVGGDFAVIPGGFENNASGMFSFAAGRRAKTSHAGTFVWADSTDADFASTGANQFLVRASGGAGIGRAPTANAFEVEGGASKTIAGDWLANSDARIKTSVETVTGALDKLDQVRLVSFNYTDNYRSEHPTIEDRRYLNVIAQEFQQVFPDAVKSSGEKLPNGENILQVDTHPLAIYSAAAVQELHRKVKAQEAEIQKLAAQNKLLQQRLAAIESKGGTFARSDTALEARLLALEEALASRSSVQQASLKTVR